MPELADVIRHSHVGRDRSSLRRRSPVTVQQGIRVREAQVNRAAVGSNRGRTVYLSVTRCNRPGDRRRVVNNIVGRTKHIDASATLMVPVTVTSAATDPVCAGAVPLPFSSESASAKLRSTAPPLVVIEFAPFTSALPAVIAPATVAASSKIS